MANIRTLAMHFSTINDPARWRAARGRDTIRGPDSFICGRSLTISAKTSGKTIVLIGLMGAGKSSVGRRLARCLRLPFADADDEISRVAGLAIPEIFEVYGEAAFRDCERQVIARMLRESPRVLATGGGAFLDPATRAAIARRGISVWLRAELDTLVDRTGRRNDRPLLRTGDPRAKLQALINERYPVYASADLVVDTGPEPPEMTMERVLDALQAADAVDAWRPDGAP